LSTFVLDLNDFDSIRQFSESFQQAHSRLDILVNNAGVVNLKEYQTNQHGYEMHMGTNHVGHFVLTGYLFPLLTSTPGARVVSVTSAAYRAGSIDYKDFDWKHREYSRTQSYGDSKLANLLFAHQLQKKFAECGSDAIVVSAHPGLTGTERQQSIGIGGFVSRWLASSVEEGCRSQLLAATAPFVKAGEFYGPRFGLRGAPHSIRLKAGIVTDELAERLWEYTEQRTGLQYRCP
jgi:NAD(P)-dependent dehydrogenase (short-subunit alcohol dehydrogenase family)